MVMKGKTSRPKELQLANGSCIHGIETGGTAAVLALGKGKGRMSIESNEVLMVLFRDDKVT